MNRTSNIETIVITALAIILFISVEPAFSQDTPYNHPELVWQTLELEHFNVHYHQGTERTARIVGGIAEEIYQPITELYGYQPEGKVHYFIRDHDDYSNGASYYYDQKIEIWASPLDFELRGTHHWLYDVVTHEFTHMIQLGAARKAPRWMPGIYFQVIEYERKKRPDVLRGYPNQIASWPVAMTVMPMWFAEGTAQFQTIGLGHDWWDSHRDMMLRVRAVDDKLLTYNEMGVFGKTTLGAESVYNHGYSIVRFIADRWGEETLKDLTLATKSLKAVTFNHAIKKVLGITGEELYNQWKEHNLSYYLEKTTKIRDNLVSGKIIHDKGFGNLYPIFSSDSKRIAFFTNQDQDYLSLGHLVIQDIEKDSLIKPKSPVKGIFDWSEDNRYFVYSSRSAIDKHGSHFNDLNLWDMKDDRVTRLTRGARLSSPSFSPDGKSIIAVHIDDGTHNLALVTLPDTIGKTHDLTDRVSWSLLTEFDDGTQIYNPEFHPNGKNIYCASTNLGSRNLYRFSIADSVWEQVIGGDYNIRNVTVTGDGKSLLYSSDRTGIYNLYRFDIETGNETAITNVLGGAFMPTLSPDGKIAYSEFTVDGYQIRLLAKPEAVDPETMKYLENAEREGPQFVETPSVSVQAKPYSTPFNSLFILPRITWDFGEFKPGFYAFTSDILDKLNLFGGFAINGRMERDIYINAEYNILYPTLFLEIFNITRENQETFEDPYVIIGERWVDTMFVPIYGDYSVDYKFELSELDLGGKVPYKDNLMLSALYRYSNYRAVLDFDDGSSFDYTYLKGNAYLFRIDSDQRALSVGSDIHPREGWRGWLEYAYEENRFLDGFEVEAERGTIVEVYKPYNFHRLETDIDCYMTLYKDWVLNPRFIGGVLSRPVDSFFDLNAGGLPGLRGYSYYSIGGTHKAVGRLSLRFPIATGIDRSWGPFYLDRIHAALFAEAGNAWSNEAEKDDVKRDVGAELRIKLFSWYGYPTDIQLTGAYSLDRFTTGYNSEILTFGHEWRWYLTILFDFI